MSRDSTAPPAADVPVQALAPEDEEFLDTPPEELGEDAESEALEGEGEALRSEPEEAEGFEAAAEPEGFEAAEEPEGVDEPLEALPLEALPLEALPLEALEEGAEGGESPLALSLTSTPSGEPPEISPSLLDPDALKVVLRLRQFGHQAYLVGGCVRDLLLERTPKDFDVATSAHPGEVRAIFRNCRLIGRRFRLAHVYFKGGKIIEVSTFRANPTEVEEVQAELELGEEDEGAEGGRRMGGEVENDLLITHDNVFGTAEQDARRRDFTMNGLFYDVAEGKVLDYVRGRRDLREREIRTIGDPEVRLREDPVRILRAVRFACRLGLDIESRTYAAMEGAVEDLPRCAAPRLLEETFRLIRGGVAAPALKLLAALDALNLLLPPIDGFIRQLGPENEDGFYAYARALDRRVQAASEPLEDAILLATLLVPISRAEPQPTTVDTSGRPSVAQAIEELLGEFVRTARLPRRIAERCRMILIAQRTLSGERRRRGSLATFRRHPLFEQSLTVFELHVEASGQHQAELDAWRQGAAPAVAPDAEGGGPRRRRRRRRRGPPKNGAPPQGATGGEG